MKSLLVLAFLLSGSIAVAQPAPAATEDHDTVGELPLPWYLPPLETPKPRPERQPTLLAATLGYHSYDGDLRGSSNELALTLAPNTPWFDFGLAIGTGSFELHDVVAQSQTPRVATNEENMYAAVLGIARNYGIEIHREGDLRIFVMGPSLTLRFGAQVAQVGNQTMPVTTGDTPMVTFAAALLEPIGLRLAACSGLVLDVRPTYGVWVAGRTFDPSNNAALDTNNTITATGTGWGFELSAGYAFWK